jgi:hypothetical protein
MIKLIREHKLVEAGPDRQPVFKDAAAVAKRRFNRGAFAPGNCDIKVIVGLAGFVLILASSTIKSVALRAWTGPMAAPAWAAHVMVNGA